MIRKFGTLSATAIAASVIAFAPLAAGAAVTSAPATVTVSADVAPTIDIADVSEAATSSWDGTTAQAVPFSLVVNTNASTGYSYTFTGANGPNYQLNGTGGNPVTVPYTIVGTGGDGTTYVNGILGGFAYPGPTPPGGTVSTFNVGLPIQGAVPADNYTDTLTVTVTTLDLT
jgi:hypothetical protein